ncbi:MAG: hypothetical protein KR126chlam1_00769 [Chlamydiae bacterium]|nr:hypothetical protein [Chlamydiota bacterium]
MFPAFLIALQLLVVTTCHLFGTVVVSDHPIEKIKGPKSHLDQPEGLAFSPSGDYLAVANARNNHLTIYARTGNDGPHYASTPACIVENAEYFEYLHEVDFSPCGNFLIAASRKTHSVVCLKRKDSEAISFETTPHWVFDHKSVPELKTTADVAFSHSGEFLGVVNRTGDSTIVLFKQLSDMECHYDPSPFQVISESALLEYDIAPSHGLTFSPDGTKLAITTKRFHGNTRGKPSLMIFEKETDKRGEPRFVPSFIFPFPKTVCPHGVAFHPSGRYLALTNSEGEVLIFEMEADENTFTIALRIPIERRTTVDTRGMQETAKGVAFSPCGNYLAFSTMNDSILVYEFQCDEPPQT